MVKLRFKRFGRRNRPFYRLNAIDQRAPRDGRSIEELGWYDPMGKEGKQLELKTERIEYWLGVGAQPSETVNNILRKAGFTVKESRRGTAGESRKTPAKS